VRKAFFDNHLEGGVERHRLHVAMWLAIRREGGCQNSLELGLANSRVSECLAGLTLGKA